MLEVGISESVVGLDELVMQERLSFSNEYKTSRQRPISRLPTANGQHPTSNYQFFPGIVFGTVSFGPTPGSGVGLPMIG
jgi:hypothetical protein